MPYRPTRFNDTVGIDLKWVKDSAGKRFHLLNILDLATSFNLGILLDDKSSKSVMEAFKVFWLSWAGPPGKAVADQGKESFGTFSELMRHLGTHFNLMALEAPWQNGMVERHGGVLGDIITATVMETSPVGIDQMKDVCMHAAMAKNRRPGKGGFAQRILVFGVDERLIASGLNHYLEEPDDAAITVANANKTYPDSMAIRKAAI